MVGPVVGRIGARPHWPLRYLRTTDRAALVVVAGAITGVLLLGADVIRRSSGRSWPIARHLAGGFAAYLLLAAALGIVAFGAIEALAALRRAIAARRPRLAAPSIALIVAGLAAAAAAPTAIWTFTGTKAQKLASSGPTLFLLAIGLAAFVVAWIAQWCFAAVDRGRRLAPALLALLALLSGGVLAWIDLTVFVALYGRLHVLLETCVTILWALACALLLSLWVAPKPRGLRVLRGVAALAVVWLVAFAAVPPLASLHERSLRHVWLDPAYAGRAMSRIQTARAFVKNPLAWRGVALSKMDQLTDRFDLADSSENPAWSAPLKEPKDFAKKIAALRGERRDFNIVFFYVDTLRYDAATDPQIMPNAVDFASRNLHFTRAYSSGSDTMRSLPAITTGRYGVGATSPHDVLTVAQRAGLKRGLVIAKSAQEFLAKERPGFRFDDTMVVPDYAAERTDVWGYGADRPTAERMVTEALDWVNGHRDRRFLLWIFNFDQHNWRELDSEWMNKAAKQFGVPDEAPLNWRYRVTARSIDAQFGRLLQGLERLGLADDTIVVFVSDHGEALGRDGFWVHSIFLWESLVHVPLAVRVPGLEPKVVYDNVSLVDLAPTLARYMQAEPDLSGYQGEDLLGYLVPGRPPRRLPILMAGASHETLLRIGILEPEGKFKLVLPLESATPELYDITDPDPDWVSLADEHPTKTLEMLSRLVRSPLFPRERADLDAEGPPPKIDPSQAAPPR